MIAGSKYDHESLRGIAAAGERDGALDRATGWESQSQIRDRLGSDDNVWEDSTSRLSWRPGGDVVRSGRDRGRLENASRVYTTERLAESIKHQQEKYDWEFLFLAANQDAIASAAKIAIPASQAMNFVASPMGVRESHETLTRRMSASRLAQQQQGKQQK